MFCCVFQILEGGLFRVRFLNLNLAKWLYFGFALFNRFITLELVLALSFASTLAFVFVFVFLLATIEGYFSELLQLSQLQAYFE